MRARILSGLKEAKRQFAETQAEYDKFKKYYHHHQRNMHHNSNMANNKTVMTYVRVVEDLEKQAAAQESFDPILFNEILALKEKLRDEYGLVYFDGYMRPFRLVPAKAKP
jgi:DNA-binding ferritin-like protein (Dps family)